MEVPCSRTADKRLARSRASPGASCDRAWPIESTRNARSTQKTPGREGPAERARPATEQAQGQCGCALPLASFSLRRRSCRIGGSAPAGRTSAPRWLE